MAVRGYTITGTDTDVGKTVFAAGLSAALRATYWKPVQAGIEGGTDSEAIGSLCAGADVTIFPEAYRLKTPCSPHEAARIDGCQIALADLALPKVDGPLVVEGAGGVLVPFEGELLAADIFADWGLPVILVARTTLGTISHSLLSMEALRSRNIELAGVAFIGEAEPVAEEAIIRIGQCRHLGRLPLLNPLDAQSLAAAFGDAIRLDLLA